MSAAEQLLNALRETLRSTSKPKRFVADVALVLAAFGQLERALADVQQRWGRLRGTLGVSVPTKRNRRHRWRERSCRAPVTSGLALSPRAMQWKACA